MKHCDANGLPPLTCLVVNQETGMPVSGLSIEKDLPRDREAVYTKNWYALEFARAVPQYTDKV